MLKQKGFCRIIQEGFFMNKTVSLAQISPGMSMLVNKVDVPEDMEQRFEDIGLIEGTEVRCIGENQAGSLLSLEIRGAVMAIRKETLEHVEGIMLDGGVHVIALAGNPNVGKSTVFNSLTGMRQHTGNWPGKTVSSASGRFSTEKYDYELIDLPGTYSLNGLSADEEVAGDYIKSDKAEVVVVICDASCLERNLILALQIIEKCPRAVVCVNMMDEAERRGIRIDFDTLSDKLGAPVIPMTARKKKMLGKLKEILDESVAAGPAAKAEMPQESEEETVKDSDYIETAERICESCVSYSRRNHDKRDRMLDRFFTGKFTGHMIMVMLLAFVMWLTIAGANYPSDLIARGLFYIQDRLSELFHAAGAPEWLHDMLVLGVYRVVSWVVSVMLPPMAIFFPLFTILEDFGYLPRVAYNLDHAFRCCGSCGKQALTACMGFGCNAAGVIGCRIIASPRERMLAILTNTFSVCNGKFAALIAIITMFLSGAHSLDGRSSIRSALVLAAVIIFGIVMALVITKLLSKTLLKGMRSSFVLEMPPYRMPQFARVAVRSVFDRTIFVLGRAAAAAAPAGFIVWALTALSVEGQSILSYIVDFLEPLGRFMGMDGAILTAFILGLPANEIIVPLILMIYNSQGSLSDLCSLDVMYETFTANGWTTLTAVCTVLFFVMHWPCATTLMTVKKETGSLKWTVLAALIPAACGFVICSAVSLFYGCL